MVISIFLLYRKFITHLFGRRYIYFLVIQMVVPCFVVFSYLTNLTIKIPLLTLVNVNPTGLAMNVIKMEAKPNETLFILLAYCMMYFLIYFKYTIVAARYHPPAPPPPPSFYNKWKYCVIVNCQGFLTTLFDPRTKLFFCLKPFIIHITNQTWSSVKFYIYRLKLLKGEFRVLHGYWNKLPIMSLIGNFINQFIVNKQFTNYSNLDSSMYTM